MILEFGNRKSFLKKIKIVIIPFFLSISIVGCCAYSFTGASVPSHLKSIAIPVADDRSGSAEAGLREMLTQKLIQKFVDDNSLQVVDRLNANSILETAIVSFADAPAIISAGENITSRRITIGIKASYRDLVKKIVIFDKVFTNYANYPASGSINDRNKAIEEIIEKSTEDILLETVSGW
ncbi:MAG: LPS assembly lipoprotein LptE [Ignavibacterium sp.]|nr:LPS assembly lipoprotein LptE [Ignavibacterium sp.]